MPTDIPPHFEVDVTTLQIGDSIHVSDLEVSDKFQIIADKSAPILSIMAPTVHAEEKTEEEGEAEAEEADQEKPEAEAKG